MKPFKPLVNIHSWSFNDRTYTNKQIIREATRLAHALQKLAVKKGDRVVVMLPNCPEVIISCQGILRSGGVIVPLIPLMNEKELNHILINCEAAAMITIRDAFIKNESILRGNKTLKSIILLDDKAPAGTYPFAQLLNKSPMTKILPIV